MNIPTLNRAHQPPSDPCMCGSFDTWHAGCYEHLSKAEILEKHKRFTAEWRERERAKALGHVKEVCKW